VNRFPKDLGGKGFGKLAVFLGKREDFAVPLGGACPAHHGFTSEVSMESPRSNKRAAFGSDVKLVEGGFCTGERQYEIGKNVGKRSVWGLQRKCGSVKDRSAIPLGTSSSEKAGDKTILAAGVKVKFVKVSGRTTFSGRRRVKKKTGACHLRDLTKATQFLLRKRDLAKPLVLGVRTSRPQRGGVWRPVSRAL